jgi:hypothetical protein
LAYKPCSLTIAKDRGQPDILGVTQDSELGLPPRDKILDVDFCLGLPAEIFFEFLSDKMGYMMTRVRQ